MAPDGNRLWLCCSEGAGGLPVGSSRMEDLLSRKSKPRRFLKGDGSKRCQPQAFGPLELKLSTEDSSEKAHTFMAHPD